MSNKEADLSILQSEQGITCPGKGGDIRTSKLLSCVAYLYGEMSLALNIMIIGTVIEVAPLLGKCALCLLCIERRSGHYLSDSAHND